MSNIKLILPEPQPKQKIFLRAKTKHVGYGGSRGGGKSFAIRHKAILLCLRYDGIRTLIVRRTYPELMNNHVNQLKRLLFPLIKEKLVSFNKTEMKFEFWNGSIIDLTYCAKDADLDKMQGVEYDVIFIDEATQLSEYQMKVITACVRGVNNFPKRIYYTCNPGGQGHGYIKRIFIDKRYVNGERKEDYTFIQAGVKDNRALMKFNPDYIHQLEALPAKKRKAWLDGDWNVYEGQFFEEFVDDESHYKDRQWTHVIEPFEPPRRWSVYRSYDFGYAKPFSCAWWVVDDDGVIYRIHEFYGCKKSEPNVGLRMTPDEQFREIAKIEREHPWLKGKKIQGVADPSIWDVSRGESVAETAERYGIYFDPGDNARIAGWMQCHYRLQFDKNGYPMMYIFSNCEAFIRTVPLLIHSERMPEDLDTEMEDHVADEWRYLCMTRPITPPEIEREIIHYEDPLNMYR